MAVPAAAVTGVLLDVDHTLDFYYWYVKKDTRRLFLLFHGWEYAVVGIALIIGVWDHPVLVAGVLGLLGHLLGDQIANRPAHPLAYSIIYRARTHFGRQHTFRETPSTLSEALHKSIPLWRLIEPRLLSVAARFQGGSH